MKNTRIIIISLYALLMCLTVKAQEDYPKHEFSVGGFAGIMSLKHDLEQGTSSDKLSGGIGLGYTYFFSKNIGLATGLDFAFYNQDIKLGEVSGSHQAFDLEVREDFEFRYNLKDYTEQQSAFYLNIPIMMHYQFAETENMIFYAAAGGKIGLPINGKYKSITGNLKTEGYYPHNKDLIDDVPFRGFGEFPVSANEDKIKYKMSVSLAFETGVKWKLSNEMFLYTGVFVDYGLNDIKKEDMGRKPLVQYNPLNPEDHVYSGILSSSNEKEGQENTFVKKINTMGYGLKVRLAFGK